MIRTPYLNSIVSRETLEKINKYCDFLIKYNKKINLISKNSEVNIMSRHIEDSAQLIKYIDAKDKNILDIGSGAGFPGIVMELIKNDLNLKFNLEIVEKSPKKCTYLQELCKYLQIDVAIHNYDVKDLKNNRFDVIASRAFKPMLTFLNILEESAINFRKILLLKGENYQLEMNEAKKYWEINCDMH